MSNPYNDAPPRAFWKKAVSTGWDPSAMPRSELLILKGEKVGSAGSCFAANIVPYIEKAGFEYVRTEKPITVFGELGVDNFNYSTFSAAYGNIYTARQGLQLVRRALGQFSPRENLWVLEGENFVDPFRPGLKFPASSELEFKYLTQQHLAAVLEALRLADMFVFTLGLTEAWVSSLDGAVFPACPGTVAGSFDPHRHHFHNFTAREVTEDLGELIGLIRTVNPRIRFILTVSPVPLVATATDAHVLPATVYSKSVLRVAAAEAERANPKTVYFPAYELVCGPQAPHDFFEADRRQPSQVAIKTVMGALLSKCEGPLEAKNVEEAERCSSNSSSLPVPRSQSPAQVPAVKSEPHASTLSRLIAEVECEEAAAGHSVNSVSEVTNPDPDKQRQTGGTGGARMNIAAVTMVYNEPEYLPIWCRYYGAQVGAENCYIVDHGSDDGSTENLTARGFNLIRIPRSPKDNTKRTRFLSEFCSSLLEWYDAVMHCDVDEIVFGDARKYASLSDYAEQAKSEFPVSALGFNVHHVPETESDLDLSESILEQRSWVRFSSSMCKPALIYSRVKWSPGFHSADSPIQFGDLFLFHLRYFDLQLGLQRLARTRSMAWASDSAGSHQRVPDESFTKLVQAAARLPKVESPTLALEGNERVSAYVARVLTSQKDYKTHTYPLDLHIFGDELMRIPSSFANVLINSGV